MVLLGDHWLEGNINKFIKEFKKSNCDAHVLLTESLHPKDFSVVEIWDEEFINLREKPDNPRPNYIFTGICFFIPLIFNYTNKLKLS